MIRLLLSGTVLATLMVGGPAMAADQAVKAPMFTKAPIKYWKLYCCEGGKGQRGAAVDRK